jgi:predicted TIM-barrel enzyme
MPEDAEYVLQRTHDVHGFYGASSMERCASLSFLLSRLTSPSCGVRVCVCP